MDQSDRLTCRSFVPYLTYFTTGGGVRMLGLGYDQYIGNVI